MRLHEYFISIDDYIRDINDFNISIHVLEKNEIDYNLFVSIRPPFNWYINIDRKPIMHFFDEASKGQERYLVQISKPLDDSDANKLKRREFFNSQSNLSKFVLNDVFSECIDSYACVFKYGSEQQLLKISREIDTKIYMLEAYKGTKLALCTNKYILSYISLDSIIVQKDKNSLNGPGDFEAYINYAGLLNKSKVLKYTKTSYFKNGKKHLQKRARVK